MLAQSISLYCIEMLHDLNVGHPILSSTASVPEKLQLRAWRAWHGTCNTLVMAMGAAAVACRLWIRWKPRRFIDNIIVRMSDSQLPNQITVKDQRIESFSR